MARQRTTHISRFPMTTATPSQDRAKRKAALLEELGDLRREVTRLQDLAQGYRAAHERLEQLATFPEENPNPVIEMNFAGQTIYLNPVAQSKFPELWDQGGTHALMHGLRFPFAARPGETRSYVVREIQVGDAVYEQKVCYMDEAHRGHIRIYVHDITRRKRAEETNQELIKRLVHAHEEERQRVSRELHDEAGQALTALKLSLELIQREIPAQADSVRVDLAEAIRLTEATKEQIRMLARGLRPPALDAVGLNLTLESFCRDFSKRTQLSIEYRGTDVSELLDVANMSLYRTLQEALANVARHAGNPRRCPTASRRRQSAADRRGQRHRARARQEAPGGKEIRGHRLDRHAGKAGSAGRRPAHRERRRGWRAAFGLSAVAGVGVIRVVIADDHDLVREGIRALLEKAPDIEVVGEAGDGKETVELVARLKPDVLLIDISMPHVNGIQALQRLKLLNLPTRAVVLSMHSDEVLVREAVQYGAKCYLLKGSVSDELLLAIRAAYRGAAYFSPAISNSIVVERPALVTEEKTGASTGQLTPRELEVLRFVSAGRTNNEIAKLMHISVKTVERHRTNLMSKLDAHNLVELMRVAIKQRLIQLDD